jgi:lipoate synthase
MWKRTRLTREVRIQAKYDQLRSFKIPKRKENQQNKSGIMLGLGEQEEEFSNDERSS